MKIVIQLVDHGDDGDLTAIGPGAVFATSAEFFNLAHMLGEMLVLLEEEDSAELLAEASAWLKEYCSEYEERAEGAFAAWWQLVSGVAAELAAQHGTEPPPEIRPKDFRQQARLFLGRLVLMGESVDEERAKELALVLGALGGFLRVHIRHYATQDERVARALAGAYEKTEMLLQFCERCEENGKGFVFRLENPENPA